MPSDPPIESDVIRLSEKSEETGDILRRSELVKKMVLLLKVWLAELVM